MKYCPKCNAVCDDNAAFCTTCGLNFAAAQAAPAYNAAPAYDPYDHTAEFNPKDVAENKLMAALVYITGVIGIIINGIFGKNSPYSSFHIRQGIKFTIIEAFLAFCSMIYSKVIFGIIDGIGSNANVFGMGYSGMEALQTVRFAFSLIYGGLIVCLIIVWFIKLITFFSVCAGKSKEPAIIRGFRFMK